MFFFLMTVLILVKNENSIYYSILYNCYKYSSFKIRIINYYY